MLSRFSVKKPYTIVVAIVLVIILGVVSFTKMNTDLLPSMNLPYAIVMTTYPGASPETVETVVTRPVEQSMATVSDIENVSSVSSENMSLVILEFAETANMDSTTIEMRENLDQISSYWDDSVGKPVIMKLNPDMMPVVVAAVEVAGLSDTEVTDYVSDEIQPNVESVAGVARVTTTGNITESVDVLIRQEKLDAMNQKVRDAMLGTFAEKEEELADAQQELDDGKQELEDGKKELEDGREEYDRGKEEAAEQIGAGAAGLEDARNQLSAGEKEIEDNLALLEEKQKELDDGRKELETAKEQAETGISQLEQSQSALEQLPAMIAGLQEQRAQLQAMLDQLKPLEEPISQALDALEKNPEDVAAKAALEAINQQLSGYGVTVTAEQIPAQIEQLESGIADIDKGIEESQSALNQILAAFEAEDVETAQEKVDEQLDTARAGLEQVESGMKQLDEGQKQLDAGKEKLEEAKTQLESGKEQLASGAAQLNTQQVLAAVELSLAGAKIDAGLTQMESADGQFDTAQEQIDSGREQLEEAKTQALDQSDLYNILTADMVKGILTAENFSMPAGYITEDGTDYLVRVGDELQEVDQLDDLVVLNLDLDGLAPIRLSDVADIAVHNDSAEIYANLNGNPGVMLSIEKQTGYSTGEVTDRILERFDKMQEENPDVKVSVLMNQGIYIDLVVDSVLKNMIYGAILAILVLLFFLKDIRPTLVIACSIPISVVTAVVLMYFSGITLNIISLSGLALGVGMLVDNSIVVIENIYRLRNEGVPARKAAVEGAKQVAGAIAASTLTTICVFAPIVFTEGITRQLFVDMGLTIAYSLLASLVVALSLVPMMAAGLLRKTSAKKTPFLDRIQNAYARLIRLALRFKPVVILLAVALLVGSMLLALAKGSAFMPEMESTQVSMSVSVDKEQTFDDLRKAADDVIASVQDMEDIETVGAMAGGSGLSSMMGGSTNSVSVYLVLREDRTMSNEEFEREVLKRTKDIPCEVSVQTSSMDLSALGGSGVSVQIKGQDLDTLQEIARDVAKLVDEVPGTTEVSDGLEEADREYRVVVNKERAMNYNLTVAQVFQEVNSHLAEPVSATTLSTASKDYSVYVKTQSDEEMRLEELRNMKIPYTNAEGESKKVALRHIADFEEATTPQSISRSDQSRYMSVTAQLETGYNIGLVSDDVEEALKDYKLPEGYTAEMQGEDETINEAMEQLMLMLVLALLFMYLIMVAQFQSLLSPFIIMFTVPLAFTGGFLGLLAADMEVSVIAMVGLIMLSGIIVNNGIVLVDYINQLRQEGWEKRDAIAEAGRTRLRPIVMTALTTILGLLTMALGVGMGADMVQPMAVVTIGGLLYGTLLTLFVVPCIYDLLNRKEYIRDEARLEDKEIEEESEASSF